ncbi:Propeptide and Peptidase A1 domain containing protein, partial [Trichostrongylus colubriformis]
QMRLALVLLVLVGYSLGGAIFKIPLKKIESVRMRTIREGTWAEYSKKRNDILERVSQDVHSQRVHDYYDNEYIGDITIGTPEQPFSVILDTSSADLWIPDRACLYGPREPCDQPKCAAGCEFHNDGNRKIILFR